MNNQIYVPQWLQLKPETRAKLRKLFDLTEDISREVCNNEVICDGFSNQMLATITLEKINEQFKDAAYDDYMTAFNTLIAKLETVEPIIVKSDVISDAIGREIESQLGKEPEHVIRDAEGNFKKMDKRSKEYREYKKSLIK